MKEKELVWWINYTKFMNVLYNFNLKNEEREIFYGCVCEFISVDKIEVLNFSLFHFCLLEFIGWVYVGKFEVIMQWKITFLLFNLLTLLNFFILYT